MITLNVNGETLYYHGPGKSSLLDFLRLERGITSAKDGCSGEGICGACTLEINARPGLACRTLMKDLDGAEVITTEGLPESFRQLIGSMFAEKGAVQCGFCSPGFIMRSRRLFFRSQIPSRREIVRAINPNLCRCTGYVKIVDAIQQALSQQQIPGYSLPESGASIGSPLPKYQAFRTALGQQPFVDDMRIDGMLHGALRFSDHPRAKIIKIDTTPAKRLPGVIRVFTAPDIPGDRKVGLIVDDWPLMVDVGQTAACIGDVLAGVVAETEAIAREAARLVDVEYQVMEPVTDPLQAAKEGSPQVHAGRSNVLESCSIRFGDTERAFSEAAHTTSGIFRTQHIEHAFLETEAAIALPEGEGLRLHSQGQGAYVDRRMVSRLLALPEEMVRVSQVPSGGGFGGKEDISVQGHAALFAWVLKRPVKLHLSRAESIRMHPKRHPVWMDMQLACDHSGKFTALRLKAVGDTGAYASVGTKVMERVVGHATGGYVVTSVDITSQTVYTNHLPAGAMRGFGVPQVVFALERCIDELCLKGGFDRWQIRYDNALEDGAATATGQRLQGVGLKKTLEAVREDFLKAPFAGIACGLKNTGVGNGMIDDSEVKIEVVSAEKVIIHHGWTEMGQGIHTMAIQTLYQETGIHAAIMEVRTDTEAGVPAGMTTSSRATALLGNAIINAARQIREDIGQEGLLKGLAKCSGRIYKGKYVCDWTTRPDSMTVDPKIHFAYGYATQVAVLDHRGKLTEVIAAHDAGKIMNSMLFEGQIEGAVHMGVGYATTENLPMRKGIPKSFRMKDLNIIRAKDMPLVRVIGIEEKDPYGPYGAKGIGEIGMVPTAAAIANAYSAFDGQKRNSLPLRPPVRKNA